MRNLIAFLAAVLLAAVPTLAQDAAAGAPAPPDVPVPPPAWGTQSGTYLPLSAWNFVPISSSVTYAYGGGIGWGIYRTNATGDNWFHAGIQLPEGASLEFLLVNVCDSTATGVVSAFIHRATSAGAVTTIVAFSNVTTAAETPGCVARGYLLPTPITFDNATYSYELEIYLSEATPNLVLVGAKLGYRLQVSPAPVTARFTDVPTSHPFFQYIEALAASGVTAGCTATQYCPDAPITRGQMAVFISRALGLHWAP